MTTKRRIAQLEKQKPKVKMTTMSDVEWQRSMNILADALNITRAEVDKQLTELFSDKPTAKP